MTFKRPIAEHVQMNLRTLAMLLNGAFWVYFWIQFAAVSLPNNGHFCLDHCLDPYVFFGYGIGLNYNPLALPFMKLMVCVQLPSFFLATVFQHLLPGQHSAGLLSGALGEFGYILCPEDYAGFGGRLFLGVSINGYRLLVTMLLSFVQWLIVVRLLSWLTQKIMRIRAINRGICP
jgi:hypothetical protein